MTTSAESPTYPLMRAVQQPWNDQPLLQLAGIAAAILVAMLLRWWLRPRIEEAAGRVDRSEAAQEIRHLGEGIRFLLQILFPALAFFTLRIAGLVFAARAWPAGLLDRSESLFAAWLAYLALSGLFDISLSDSHAEALRKNLLRPALIILVGLYISGLTESALSQKIHLLETPVTVGALLAGIAALLFSIVLSRSLRHYLGKVALPQAGIEPALGHALSTLVAYFILIVGMVFALEVVGLDLSALAVVVGGLSVGIGFGLQEIISNFFSGFILLIERSIGPGDVVEVEGSLGRVENVGIRSTRIRTIDNVEIILPNSQILNGVVTNYSSHDPRIRVSVQVGVSYDSDPKEVEEALLKAADHPDVLDDPPPEVELIGFGDSSLDFSLEAWTDNAMEAEQFRSAMRFRIWYELGRRGVEIPFPQRDVHIRDASKERAS